MFLLGLHRAHLHVVLVVFLPRIDVVVSDVIHDAQLFRLSFVFEASILDLAIVVRLLQILFLHLYWLLKGNLTLREGLSEAFCIHISLLKLRLVIR